MAALADSRIGTELAGYRIEELIGRGGMGVVYRARDLALDRDVALKLLAPHLADDVSFRERFLTESRVAASLEHPNVVPIHDAGEIDGQLYIAMRLVEGSDLKAVLREGPIEPARAVRVLEQVAGALEAAHARGLVHRDVKPSNVLLDEREHVYLADFGLSRYLGDAALPLGPAKSLGTADYVAPEQIRGEEVDGRADVYALGCMLYECLAGVPPFRRATDAATLYAQLEESPPILPELEEVLPRALAKEPAERYATCGELIEDARDALGIAEPKRNRWPLAVAAVGVALIAAALLGFFLTRGGVSAAALPGADSLVRIDPRTNKVQETISVGRKASGVAVAGRYVWVANAADGNVWRIDPDTGRHLAISTNGSPTGVAAGADVTTVVNGPQRSIAVIDAGTGSVDFVAATGPGNAVLRVAAGREGVWFADPSRSIAGTVGEWLRGNAQPSVQAQIPPDETTFLSSYETFDGLAVGEGGVWAAGDAFGRTVWRIDPQAGGVTATIRLPFIPNGIAAGEGAVWVTSLLNDTVARIDPATNRVTKTIRVGKGAGGVAVGSGSVWVANTIDGTVSRVDPATIRVVSTIGLAGAPQSIAAGPGGVWLTTRNSAAETVGQNEIRVGVLVNCAGAFGQFGDVALAGAELALLERGGRLAGPRLTDGVNGVSIDGKPVRVFYGCSDGTASSALLESRRLVERVGVDVLIGPLRGEEGVAIQEYARRQPTVAFVNGSSSTQLLDPAPNFFSFHPDGAQWMAGLGTYAYRTLGWRTAVTLGDLNDDLYAWGQAAGFTAEFCALGGKIVKRIWIPPATTDFSGVVAQIPPAGVDGIVAATRPETVVALAKGVRQLRGNISRKLFGSGILIYERLGPLGNRVRGLVSSGPFVVAASPALTKHRKDFARAFRRLRGFAGNVFDVFYFDAMNATLKALDTVHGDLSEGERRFMAALGDVELDSAYGHIALDSRHQAVAPNYLARRTGVGAKVPTLPAFRTVPDVERTFGGYFKPTDPPPSRTTPACVKRTPPPWSR